MEIWPVMKWVLIVLLVGFIGQFGKSLAQTVMKKMRTPKTKTKEDLDRDIIAAASDVKAPDNGKPESFNQQKLQKKALKTLAKEKKKGNP